MNIKQYLTSKNMSHKEFAKRLGCSEVRLSRIIHGAYPPRTQIAVDIENLTCGDVSAIEVMMIHHIRFPLAIEDKLALMIKKYKDKNHAKKVQ